MADLHPAYPREGADQQDAHARAPRNFPTMDKGEHASTTYRFNEKDEGPSEVGTEKGGFKDPYQMSPKELKGLGL